MRDRSADDFAAMQDDDRRRREAADARALGGSEIAALRRALDAASLALSRINEKGLVFAHRAEVVAARDAIARARPLVAPRMPAG